LKGEEGRWGDPLRHTHRNRSCWLLARRVGGRRARYGKEGKFNVTRRSWTGSYQTNWPWTNSLQKRLIWIESSFRPKHLSVLLGQALLRGNHTSSYSAMPLQKMVAYKHIGAVCVCEESRTGEGRTKRQSAKAESPMSERWRPSMLGAVREERDPRVEIGMPKPRYRYLRGSQPLYTRPSIDTLNRLFPGPALSDQSVRS
jgi:hypothetical protein